MAINGPDLFLGLNNMFITQFHSPVIFIDGRMKNICFCSEDEAFTENGIQLFHNMKHSKTSTGPLYIIYTHKFRTTMNIRKKVLQATALFAAAGAQAQNPIIQTINIADPGILSLIN
ncbi:hypothetical protein SAMN05216524_103167 [Mucilaginibacter sp. OK098]|nr:hypothetical protein SAMN05216524_103167 [Mucilaginibacter sp. OK098]